VKEEILSRIANQNKLRLSKEELTFLKIETPFLPEKISLTERLWYWKNEIIAIVKCQECGDKVSWSKPTKSYVKYCHKCNIKSTETRQKSEATNILKRGVKNPFQSQDVKDKSSNTKAEKYGDKSYNNRKKFQETCDTLYGKTSYTKTLEYFKRTIKGNLTVQEVEELYTKINDNNWLAEELSAKSCSQIAKEQNIALKSIIRRAVSLGLFKKDNQKSSLETHISNFVSSLTTTITNTRSVISPYELDIFCEEPSLAIEIDGLYWHSHDKLNDKNYHLKKTDMCSAKGIHLLHIFENEWLDSIKQKIWKSIIANKLGRSTRLYARNCEVKSVSNSDKRLFLENNHLQGDCPSRTNIGLYHDNVLVSLMTFGKSRFNKEYDWELLRFCNLTNYSIVGGASRLLKAFKRSHHGKIISYADKRRSDGNLYKQLGFTHTHDSSPNFWYFKSNQMKLESRIKFQKHKQNNVLENFDSALTADENMKMNGYRKIYDCGNQVWVL